MKNIQADIKSGNFKQVYLLYGEEAYLKQQYKQNLVKALNPDGDTMNFNHYEGKGIDVKQLIDLCETMPFFAERRVVLLEDTGFFKNKCEELADYMKELPDYLYLVFAETEVDKRNRMYKAVKSCGSIAEFIRQDEKTLMRWAAGILGKAGKKITQRDMELLLTKTGTDMGNLRMEMEKLISYTEGRDVVTAEDIEEICTTQTTNRIFDMVRAVTEKNQKRALELYYDLLTLSVSIPAMMIGHITLFGLAEIILTVVVLTFVEKVTPKALDAVPDKTAFKPLYILMAVLIVLTPLGLLATGTAWGEWGADEIAGLVSGGSQLGYTPSGMTNGFELSTLFPDYSMSGLPEWTGYILSAIVGVALLVIIFKIISSMMKEKVDFKKKAA